MLRLPRPQNGQAGCVRNGDPPGGSTCTTSQPKSASVCEMWVPVSVLVKSATRSPSRGPAM